MITKWRGTPMSIDVLDLYYVQKLYLEAYVLIIDLD